MNLIFVAKWKGTTIIIKEKACLRLAKSIKLKTRNIVIITKCTLETQKCLPKVQQRIGIQMFNNPSHLGMSFRNLHSHHDRLGHCSSIILYGFDDFEEAKISEFNVVRFTKLAPTLLDT